MNKENHTNNNQKINYLRLSITDRCNLRCKYCMPDEGIDYLPHSEILRYEEMLHLVGLAVKRGIRKVRLTGGEPLVRKGFIDFIKQLGKIEGLDEITLTTNGVLLKQYAAEIKASGVHRINISLDSLRPDRFFHITGRDCFKQVWEGIQEAERQTFSPIKINVVAIRGVNDDEIADFARLTLEKPYHIRFIEIMPIGGQNSSLNNFIPVEEIHGIIQGVGNLRPIHRRNNLDGPAQRFVLEGGKGEIGMIGAMSSHFCDICNRLRLTAEGHIRSCLFSDRETDIKTPLREGKGDDSLLELFDRAIEKKDKSRGVLRPEPRKCVRQMSSIGG